MLEARELEATRGDAVLFSGLSFSLAPGALLHVTGANGSGKTSLLRALCGLLLPTAGEVRWKGESIRRLREEYARSLAYIGHANALKEDLTAEENLAVACALTGTEVPAAKLSAALQAFGLGSRARLPVRALSQGQRRRATLARLAVSGSTPLWILDEPFAALDAAAVDLVRSLVEQHLGGGGMLVITSHQDVGLATSSQSAISLDRP
jgi:heme exporter protein A